MSESNLSALSADELMEVCSRSMYTIDGLWFLSVEEKFGFEVAFELNQRVWERCAPILGRRLKKKLDLEGKPPLQALAAMLQADPMMIVHKPIIHSLTDDMMVVRCMECPIQVARIRDGRGVYNGKPGCSLYFKGHAGLIDPRINVTCVSCAPNPDNPEFWCEWEFILSKDK
jgi:hypothetical protein